MWLSRDLNDVYLVKAPVLTEYMMRRLMSVSDLSELNFGKAKRGYENILFVPRPHFVKEIRERCGGQYIRGDA
jgi:hypothetical protein